MPWSACPIAGLEILRATGKLKASFHSHWVYGVGMQSKYWGFEVGPLIPISRGSNFLTRPH